MTVRLEVEVTKIICCHAQLKRTQFAIIQQSIIDKRSILKLSCGRFKHAQNQTDPFLTLFVITWKLTNYGRGL